MKPIASILRLISLSQGCCFYSPCFFSFKASWHFLEISQLFSSVVLYWKRVSKNATSPPLHAVRLLDGNESLVFYLIAESVLSQKSELHFLQACSSPSIGFISKFWLQSLLPCSALTQKTLALLRGSQTCFVLEMKQGNGFFSSFHPL